VQTIYYSIEEIADTFKMRVPGIPPVKYSFEPELVAIKEKQKLKLKQSYSKALQGGRGEGALKPPRRTGGGWRKWGT